MKPSPGKVWIYRRQSVGNKELMISFPKTLSQFEAYEKLRQSEFTELPVSYRREYQRVP